MPADRSEKRRRPGGRSAEVRARALAAALAVLMEQGIAALTMAEVARRSGVHETSLYRRWGTTRALAAEACLDFAGTTFPVPDTGSLRGDLLDLGRRVASFLSTPTGLALLTATVGEGPELRDARRTHWLARAAALRLMFERAVLRGELARADDGLELLELLIAPLYFRALVSGAAIADWPIEPMTDRILRGLAAVRDP